MSPIPFSHNVRETTQVVELLRETPAFKAQLAERDGALVKTRKALLADLRRLEKEAEASFPRYYAAVDAAVAEHNRAQKALREAGAKLNAAVARRSQASLGYDRERQRIEDELRATADNDAIDGFRRAMFDAIDATRKMLESQALHLRNRVTGKGEPVVRSNARSIQTRVEAINEAIEAAETLRSEPDQRLVPEKLAELRAALPAVERVNLEAADAAA